MLVVMAPGKHSGPTVQEGVNALQPGDTLIILPGEYHEAVSRENLGNEAKADRAMNRPWLAFGLLLPVCAIVRGEEAGYESFEDRVPAYFVATRSESLRLSSWHSKHGKSSLRWDWLKGEELVIHHSIGDVSRVGGFYNSASFSVWVYLERPVADALVFEFREGERVTGSFRFPLESVGWRPGRPFYRAFPSGKPTTEVDNIRIAAPNQVASGTVFFDFIGYNTLTYQHRAIYPEKVAQRRRPVPDERRFLKPDRLTEAELAGIRKLLAQREGAGIGDARVKWLCERVQALGIVRDEHGVRGPGLDAVQYYVAAPGEYGAKDARYWPDEHGPNGPGLQSIGPLVSLATQVARAYRASNDAPQRDRLSEAFLLVADHLLDQGQSLRVDSLFLMRDVLAQGGRLQAHSDMVLHTSRASAFFVEDDAYVRSDMDFYSYNVRVLLRLCLVQADAAEQVRWLNAFKAMLERSMLQPLSGLKIDGSAYHHRGHYHSYAQGAFAALPRIFQQLRDTPWRLSAEAHQRLRRAMLAQRLYANRLDLPIALKGRSTFAPRYGTILPHGVAALATLAGLGTPDGKQEVDAEVAAAYLRLAPEAINKKPCSRWGVTPEPDPSGTFVMPYAGLLCHRRDNWLASVKGQSKYVWGSERQAQRNCHALFQGLGNLEILAGGNPVSAKASGREHLGWDWRRFEGTTVPQSPLKAIDKSWVDLVWSPETFVGGLASQGRQGIFAMIVNQPMPEKKTLTGRKSWFFSDERILCLGTDISCDEAQVPTQTTLCQKRLARSETGGYVPTSLDGADLVAFPEERALDKVQPHWFLDIQRTGYYLPTGQDVTVARQHQASRDFLDTEDTQGDFLTAWIDHGKAPNHASYEYLLVVRATPELMQRLVAEPPYRVLQRDQAAHIVWDATGRRWGCVLFAPQEINAYAVGPETLQVKSVDRPCLIMQGDAQDGQLALSVADPDLNLVNRVSQPRALRVALRGAWRLLDSTGIVCVWQLPDAREAVRILSTSATETVIEVVSRHGASYDLRLARR